MDGVHLDFRDETRRMDLTWRGWIDTCPSFYRADLKLMTRAEIEEAKLPQVCEEGLKERD
ncbi:hypothetical protein [Roseinatronobacter monicus]|uniref:hypothetical protein n=1 Tax=Roseinatronobacter monicus TaxID=393481 RepID=UPI00114F7453|nr:hypothetical protein [Roseinatronobacter monicus]